MCVLGLCHLMQMPDKGEVGHHLPPIGIQPKNAGFFSVSNEYGSETLIMPNLTHYISPLQMCVLGLCHLMQMPDKGEVVAHAPQLLPSALLLFEGLKRAYAARTEAEEDEDGSEEEEGGADSELLESDEDEIDDEGEQYLESLQVRGRVHNHYYFNYPLINILTILDHYRYFNYPHSLF